MVCALVTQNVIPVGNYTLWPFVRELHVRHPLNANGILVLVEYVLTVVIAPLMKQPQNHDVKERDVYHTLIASQISLASRDFAVRVLSVALMHQIIKCRIGVKALNARRL